MLKESDDLVILGVTFDSKLTFEKHLRLISSESPGECFMIDHFLRDASDVLSYQFWRTVLQCGAWLPILTLNYWTMQSAVPGS